MNSEDLTITYKLTWVPFLKTQVTHAPTLNGVYILRMAGARTFGRLKGVSDIMYIGCSGCKGGLKQRLSQYFQPGKTQWTNQRINSFLTKYSMEIAWVTTEQCLSLEHKLLNGYLENHDELPPLNHADTKRLDTKIFENSYFADKLTVKLVKGKD